MLAGDFSIISPIYREVDLYYGSSFNKSLNTG
jgi:hypothetical protein